MQSNLCAPFRCASPRGLNQPLIPPITAQDKVHKIRRMLLLFILFYFPWGFLSKENLPTGKINLYPFERDFGPASFQRTNCLTLLSPRTSADSLAPESIASERTALHQVRARRAPPSRVSVGRTSRILFTKAKTFFFRLLARMYASAHVRRLRLESFSSARNLYLARRLTRSSSFSRAQIGSRKRKLNQSESEVSGAGIPASALRYRPGLAVEVLRKGEGRSPVWLPGTVVKIDNEACTIQREAVRNLPSFLPLSSPRFLVTLRRATPRSFFLSLTAPAKEWADGPFTRLREVTAPHCGPLDVFL